ncbi:hypothetical protein EJB05_32507 [Eragrostis curvula]|uniref:Uncharacterized protein n=1 Tax=Eragrostis curvula TaxID=38414 RepID=A0A5J9UGB6_9POAL|nr:hypothetical protein EJB05_32507 [Eragrostis curvula]
MAATHEASSLLADRKDFDAVPLNCSEFGWLAETRTRCGRGRCGGCRCKKFVPDQGDEVSDCKSWFQNKK